ncbi:hypothetical protein HMPREF0682_0755 [Propionibacterium acidifaciens F0233]|uniref:Uncharacterized protein n=1 Tax=Propionibacterium acidifaciens F0233 TaxID=553198 RepID=U2RLW3_9ACTN|nr:hypothetical protein HMPREF0682_0755 [Propionibacterium acidifaciens F0233]
MRAHSSSKARSPVSALQVTGSPADVGAADGLVGRHRQGHVGEAPDALPLAPADEEFAAAGAVGALHDASDRDTGPADPARLLEPRRVERVVVRVAQAGGPRRSGVLRTCLRRRERMTRPGGRP